MYDVTASFQKTPTGTPTVYNAAWGYNGVPVQPTAVPQSAAGDSAGYSADFGTANPSITLSPGDAVSVIVTPYDAANLLTGIPTTASITIPVVPPPPVPPGAVVGLSLSVTGP